MLRSTASARGSTPAGCADTAPGSAAARITHAPSADKD